MMRTAPPVAFALMLLAGTEASARDHQVKMLNKGADGGLMAFEPAFLKIAPGDTVTFLPVDKGHNAESLPKLAPEGAPTFKGAINQRITVRFAKQGLYGYQCLPHTAMGMVGLIQVGGAVDKAAVTAAAGAIPGMGKRKMAALLTQVR